MVIHITFGRYGFCAVFWRLVWGRYGSNWSLVYANTYNIWLVWVLCCFLEVGMRYMLVNLFIYWETLLPYLKQIEKGRYLLVTRHRPGEGVELGPVGVGRCHIKWPLRCQKRKVGVSRCGSVWSVPFSHSLSKCSQMQPSFPCEPLCFQDTRNF